jgi:TolB-like protein
MDAKRILCLRFNKRFRFYSGKLAPAVQAKDPRHYLRHIPEGTVMHRFRRCSFFLGVVLCICAAAGAVHAGQVVTEDLRLWARDAVARESALDTRPAPNTVAVLYFDNQTRRPELDPLRKGLAVMLITDLSKIDSIQVVERTRLQALIDEIDLGESGLVDPSTAPRVGRLLGAAYLVGGRLLPVQPDDIRIDSDLLRTASRDALGNPTRSGPLEELLRMEKEIAFEIVRLLGLELSPDQIRELEKPLTTDLKALMFWFQGIGLSDRQDYTRAAAAYRMALQADPAFGPAAAALNELRSLKLVPAPRDTTEMLEGLRRRVSVNDGPEPDEIYKRERPGPMEPVREPAFSDITIGW